jgi:hypothetical protein
MCDALDKPHASQVCLLNGTAVNVLNSSASQAFSLSAVKMLASEIPGRCKGVSVATPSILTGPLATILSSVQG